MAAMIGRGKSWLWWMAGLFCAALFGHPGAAGEEPAQALYGVRVDPGFVGPAAPRRPMPPENPELKQKANKLIDEYLAAQNQPAAGDELKARIEKLVKELGAEDWAAREKASKELIGIGKPALAALQEAAKSKDAEVAQRAKGAAAQIEGAGSTVEQLAALGGAGLAAVQERAAAERKAITSKAGAAGEAELAGKKDEAEKLRAEAKTAQANVALLVKLQALLAQANSGPTTGQPAWSGVKMMLIERD